MRMAGRFPDPGFAEHGRPSGPIEVSLNQLPLELGHTPSHARADFIAGEGNRLALSHLLAFPAWPHPITVVMGPAKSGKSHLARIWAERAGADFPLPSDIAELARSGGGTALVVEDIDRLAYDEQALFHLLNQSMRENRPVLLTAREAVTGWPYRTEDVKSRARLATTFTIAPAGDAELAQMFHKLFGDRQVWVDPKVIDFLVTRMERSPEEVAVLADLLDRLALAHATAITRRIATEALNLRRLVRGASDGPLGLEGDEDE